MRLPTASSGKSQIERESERNRTKIYTDLCYSVVDKWNYLIPSTFPSAGIPNDPHAAEFRNSHFPRKGSLQIPKETFGGSIHHKVRPKQSTKLRLTLLSNSTLKTLP